MNFLEKILVRKEVDDVMNAIKKYWPTALHVIAAGSLFLDPAVRAFLQANPKYAGVGLLVWAEVMRWFQSQKNAT